MTGSFTFDANKCTGCGACRVACTIENGLAPDVSWRRIDTYNPQRRSIAPVFHLSLACNHCATAACMNACPALAYRRDESTGAVLLDSHLCIGCGYCSWACPYDAPVFDENAGVMTKCTWCTDRLHVGLAPACVSHCPTGALGFADVPAASRVSAMVGLVSTTLGPHLHVTPLHAGRTQPDMSNAEPEFDEGELPGSAFQAPATASVDISLRREWPLAIFTYGAAVLVAIVAGAATGAYRLPASIFLIAAAAVMGIAGVHLGRKERGWRAVLNVRRSWLSREIVMMSAFVALAATWLTLAPGAAVPGWAAVLVGVAALVCADSVYGVLPAGPGYLHSASVTTTGAMLSAAMTGSVIAWVPLLALKALMYFGRTESRRLPQSLSAIRVVTGFAAPVVLWPLDATHVGPIACMLLSEAIGRSEYYMQLRRRTPRAEMDLALSHSIAMRQSPIAISRAEFGLSTPPR